MLTEAELAEVTKAFLDDAPVLIMLVDRDGLVVYLNRFDHGFSREQVIGRPYDADMPAEDRERVRPLIERAMTRGENVAFETKLLTPNGEAHYRTWVGPVRQEGEIRYVSMVSFDITAEREARRALHQSEERFRILVENAPEAIVIYDADTGRLVDVNPKAVELFGRPREDLLSKGPVDLSPEHQAGGERSADLAMEWLGAAMNGDRPTFEWTHVGARGEPIECEVRLVRLPHPERRWIRGSITDITARKAAERENAKLGDQLAHAQKMQAVGQLTGGVAHDFNNLLTVIGSSIAMIEMEAGNAGKTRHLAGFAREASERAAQLTQRLLAFSRQQPLRPRPVDLRMLVRGMQSLLERSLGETIRIETELAGGLWRCVVDPAQLENAILNLSINARDAMPGGGELTIAARNGSIDESDDFDGDVEPGDYVILSVRDTGEGIPSEHLPKVVEPFFTTKEVGKGSGLGLSMVYGFAKQSDGHLEIDSEVGAGTTVRLFFPRSDAPARPVSASPPPAVRPPGGGQQVLVVEDDETLRRLIANLLGRLGFQAITARDGPSALSLLEQLPEVELLLSDLVLPGGIGGVELAGLIRERRGALPVVFMSGYSEDVETDELGPLLHKPFTLADLAEVLRAVLAER